MSIKRRRILLYILAVMIPALLTHNRSGLHAQPGGSNTWEFLNLTSSARVASLGGKNISLRDGDPGLVFHNPSLLDSTMHNHLSLNYVNYLADINYGYALWAFHHRRLGSFAAGIHYIDYGSFLAADHTGNITGNFTARENSFNLSWATAIDSLFTFGATLKGISSSFEQYHSWGMALDAGINYYNPARLLSASVVMKNLGTQLSTWYAGGENEPLPFELQLGLTKQLAHAPFRFSILYQHLQDFNLQAKRPEEDQPPPDQSLSRRLDDFGSEFIRHLVAGVEFIPVQSFAVNIGYNSLRRHELKIDDKASTAGFSWGFNLQITRFRVGFGQARYHLAGSSSHFSVTTNLSSLYSR
jgi:hypothetical protein